MVVEGPCVLLSAVVSAVDSRDPAKAGVAVQVCSLLVPWWSGFECSFAAGLQYLSCLDAASTVVAVSAVCRAVLQQSELLWLLVVYRDGALF